MLQQPWADPCRNHLVCVDSYDGGVLKGRFYNPCRDMESFSSLSQFLIKMEQLLDDMQMPQSYTSPRTFSHTFPPDEDSGSPSPISRGAKATFELQVIFRRNTSWQGVIRWREQNTEQSFRSVLELVILMDSALRSMEGSGVA